MHIDQIRRIAVVGSGTMGSGIAQLAAQAGYETLLYDVMEEAAVKGLAMVKENLRIAEEKKKISGSQREETLSRLSITNNFNDLVADVIIEAIVERLETKSELLISLALLNDDEETIFCSNTSSIPITQLAKRIPHPERIVGMHFFNPPHLMKLVEVVSGTATSKENALTVYSLAQKLGKEPVMTKDAPGFIVNRIGKMFHTEPLKILEEGIATVETIDQLMEASGFKMGPFKLIDMIGVDTNLSVTKSLYEQFYHEDRFRPSRLQQQLVDSGFFGKKS
ncbi:MAG: 3-hydroxybutyryl-CoA dehydrogenase, partial [Chitinophagales bacterium]|nr:3-hydroxybutyryl-CoA dehydrogenase [Chitinophagales bacterium]